MPRQIKRDPYCDFKDDQERRLALNTRVRSYALAMVVMAVAGVPIEWMEKFRWLMNWFH